jgi:hypothetical protein
VLLLLFWSCHACCFDRVLLLLFFAVVSMMLLLPAVAAIVALGSDCVVLVPERVVHARGTGAHGYFQVYEGANMSEVTTAKVFQDPKHKTPTFVRFSTVLGFRGSADCVRDVRGFAVKMYTEEGKSVRQRRAYSCVHSSARSCDRLQLRHCSHSSAFCMYLPFYVAQLGSCWQQHSRVLHSRFDEIPRRCACRKARGTHTRKELSWNLRHGSPHFLTWCDVFSNLH